VLEIDYIEKLWLYEYVWHNISHVELFWYQ